MLVENNECQNKKTKTSCFCYQDFGMIMKLKIRKNKANSYSIE